MSDKCCKTCKHLNVEPDANGRRVVRQNCVYRCGFIPPMPPLPDSITRCYGFNWPPTSPRYMTGAEGKTCPTWEARNV